MTPLRCYLPYHHWAIQGHWAPTAGYKEESLMRFSLRLVLASRSDDDDKDDGDEWEILEERAELSCRLVRRSFLLGEEKEETSYYQLLSLRSLS